MRPSVGLRLALGALVMFASNGAAQAPSTTTMSSLRVEGLPPSPIAEDNGNDHDHR